ncbi:protein HEADING DATE 3B-like [Cucurbita pepo subsp. pepo]|uniref:protein HEADING DATE 3B-like n=1 Tax=Cucurbita pepo subsp. pepo TaxID=3664 RepID=UPI000C9D321C|nr:protein HEADING DATE 3B-like [Cucurbita pepo subsp. pepo]XP_023547923.1 protein HEADING DATE 3B-like [Cucurbita pepo subsp. pepo]XP_023547924.1 protein HEADING DATE 3B-like [Cucurbita pepo subsp. pepo]
MELGSSGERMRGEKDEEKVLSPMFPRLHVNDTEKGGPRAPPRNKMALYEQLTIPTQRFSSGSASATPLPSSTPAPLTSSSHFAGQKRGIFSASSKCSVQPHQVEKLHSYSSRGVVQSNEAKLLKTSLVATGSLSSNPQRNSVTKIKVSNLKNFSSTDAREKDDEFSIPASDQPITGVHNHDRERMSSRSMSSSAQIGIACEPQANIAVTNFTSRKYVGNEGAENPNLTKATRDPVERPVLIASATGKPLLEVKACPSTKYKDSEKTKLPHPSMVKENWTSVSNSNRLFDANVRVFVESLTERNSEVAQDKVGCTQVTGLEKLSMVIREPCSLLSPRVSDRNFENLDNRNRTNEFEKFSTVHLRDVEQKDNASDASLVDSTTAPNMSPDVIVGLIGEKQFWKARKAIVHQQRIFAVQVFELHRLIEVQKLIAGSPHILLEDYLEKPLSTLSAVKNKLTECAQQPVSKSTMVKDHHQKPNLILSSKCADKNPVAKLPLPSFNKDNSKLAPTQQTSYELRVKDTPQTPTDAAPKSDPWCLNHPTPGNQWLVPVMSPSEGLIYKPYGGPCPPSAGFMTPMYGNYGTMSLNTGSGARDFYTPAYAVPASHHQGFGYFPGTIPLNQTYFPPYGVPVTNQSMSGSAPGVPVTNQSMSGSAPDQMSLFDKAKSKEQENQISTRDINYLTHQENSCEMPSQTSHSMPFQVRKFHRSKGSELLGSTASSPSKRGDGDVLPLFPTEPPAVEESSPNVEISENKSRAIKVVPHHPKTATESAARIFQLIQEERNQL